MKVFRRLVPALVAALLVTAFQGCETMQSDQSAQRAAMNAAIRAEAPGNYFIGRRFYKQDYKMWGWVRQPGQPWSTAKLVMMNEQKTLAPDRQQGHLGADNNFEYRLSGYFSGDTVYEPASDRFYPEFVLTGYELRATEPPLIFKDPRSIKPDVRLLTAPM
ncbi:MAG: hypothetical protein PHC88_14670 [Terrimicrobiaceae bacterium]|nr:hypothetical protein [Terrimicrobiaceae bacterium]